MVTKQTLSIQKHIDHIVDIVFLRFIPHSITPNQVTYLRFVMTPFVYYLLASQQFVWGLLLFIVAASTDFIDGAMARTRNQITSLGKVIDPIADKLLILAVFLYIGFDYWIVNVFVVFIVLELIAILFSVFFSFQTGRVVGANLYGKIKMILQSISVVLFLLAVLIENDPLILISEYILLVALFFAILSGVEHAHKKIKNRKL